MDLTTAPAGYAVIGDVTNGYGYPLPERAFLVDVEAPEGEYGHAAQLGAARDLARAFNRRDAGTDQGWCVVALVPVN